MKKHPVETAIARMLPRDQRIADQLAEAGFSDEALYAALPNPGADKLLRGTQPPKAKKRAAGVRGTNGETLSHQFPASSALDSSASGESTSGQVHSGDAPASAPSAGGSAR